MIDSRTTDTSAPVLAWAERKYGVAGVASVEFEFENDLGWSEMTPGAGPLFWVRCRDAEGSMLSCVEEDDLPKLIVEACRDAA